MAFLLTHMGAILAVDKPTNTAADKSINIKHATNSEINNIRKELKILRESYEQRILSLESRLQQAEKQLQIAEQDTQVIVEENAEKIEQLAIEVSQQSNQKSANTFNPAIGVILNGKFNSQSAQDFNIPGFFLGEEAGPGSDGLGLGESEVNLSANIDDKFFGSITLAFGEETEVEEAYLQTTSMDNGLAIKAGRFFSNVGYLNVRHAHSDDFASRPIAYEAFLGKNFGDDGVQLTWLAPGELYWESGVELFRGESFPASGAGNNGTGTWTVFSHIGGDLSASQSWRAGISWLDARVNGRETAEEEGNSGESFSGDSELLIADFIWKWAPNGNASETNAKIQAEYFSRTESGDFTDLASKTLTVDSDQTGWYIQGIYQFMPQWRIGLRQEQLDADSLLSQGAISPSVNNLFAGTILDNLSHQPVQTSLMLDWTNSEFSRIRLQYSKSQILADEDELWTLQYIAAFGAHGAHSF